ncbi:MAG: cobaltochelatase subunit CobN [Candidatus Promineifilaceae bacterium]
MERGFAPVPTDLYHNEWERRKLRNKVHLSQGGCLGPCTLANVSTLFFDGRFYGFQAVDDPIIITAIYDYIEAMMKVPPSESAFVPLPAILEGRTFNYFDWSTEISAAGRMPEPRQPETGNSNGILFLSHADTDVLAVNTVLERLPDDFPPVSAESLLQFKSEATFTTYLNNILPSVQVIVARVLGGRVGFRDGFDALVKLCREQNKDLVVVSGSADLDPELTAASNVPLHIIHDTYNYLTLSGLNNFEHMLRHLADNLLIGGYGYEQPQPQPRHGIYYGGKHVTQTEWLAEHHDPNRSTAAIFFYRSHWLTGNTTFVDALVSELETQGMNALPVFTYSLKEQTNGRPTCFELLFDGDTRLANTAISTMSFALGKINMEGATQAGWNVEALQALGIPVLQAMTSGMTHDQWRLSTRGLSPLDTAMNVALPEFDGRIITVPISFKGDGSKKQGAGSKQYVPIPDRIRRVVGQAQRLATLQTKTNADKTVALVLTNAPGKASRIGNAVGLDTPASIINLLHEMAAQGYDVGEIPVDGDTLIHTLIDRCSYDTDLMTEVQIAQAEGLSLDDYKARFANFPERNRREMTARWNGATNEAYFFDNALKFAGLRFGNVFVALQPPRGYGMDPIAIYHQPDLPPTHHYAAFYSWIKDDLGADVIIHMGKHGTLEWMPGKGVGLSQECYPDLFQDDLPLIYPFIINDPGEGMQAKRRAHAVIIDHLMPPMTSAETYGDLEELQQLVDQYYQLEALDPTKLPVLQQQIWEVMRRANLDDDLTILSTQNQGDDQHPWDSTPTEDGTPVTLAEMSGKDFAHLMEDIDGYLCEIGTLQIRDGLYTLGKPIKGQQLTDTVFALTRLPNLDVPSLRESIAAHHGWDLSDLLDSLGSKFETPVDTTLITHADAVEFIDATAKQLLADPTSAELQPLANRDSIQQILGFINSKIVPALQESEQQEIAQILVGLRGGYVPAGPSGSPTRGMAHILPTGRNFYAVDPRGIPNQTAWRVGVALADELLAKYLREEGSYPERVGLSIWGTSAMRTHGDDLAECFALMGVRPKYQRENRRIIGIEVISLEELGRPRIDVLMRISGFFRDAFPHLIQLLDDAVQVVAGLDEPLEMNFIRKHVLEDSAENADQHGDTRTASYRIFGSKPGSYGAGILPLIDEQNWENEHDFAKAYVNWGGYAYSGKEYGVDMRDTFKHILAGVKVAVKNQDNREHDIFDSDDYLQYHGGMIASIRALSGKQPRQFFGDNADPARVKVRDLKEEARRVFRSRVVNPKWLDSIRRHGYKGGLELAATVDYLFGYDATSNVLADWMYERVTEAYVFDDTMREFLEQSNPWARQAMTDRLLEAIDRGLWENPDQETHDKLLAASLEAEGVLEDRL